MSTTLGCTAPHIYRLPDEILSNICQFAAEPNPLCKSMQIGIQGFNVSFDAQRYQSTLAMELKVAHVLRLVSRRFSYLATPLLFQRLVLIQDMTDVVRATRPPWNRFISNAKLSELADLGAIMEKLHDIFRSNPGLRRHCKSLCVVYEAAPVDYTYTPDQDDEEDEDEVEEVQQSGSLIHSLALGNDLFSWLTNVTDLHIHVGLHTREMPDFLQALKSMPNLTTLRITGRVEYLGIFDQIATLEPGASLQTLDMSEAMAGDWDYHEINRQKTLRKLQVNELHQHRLKTTSTAPFTRLLAGPGLDAEALTALVAWPKSLERLAYIVDQFRMPSHAAHGSSLQPALDTQKHSLTHLRLVGPYEIGLFGFDLRDFPRLEHLSLCNAIMSNFNQYPRNKTVIPELDAQIFAPRLRSLLWVLPWWRSPTSKARDFFSKKHEKRFRSLLTMALRLREERGDEEWQFERIWVQSVLDAPDPSREKVRRNFEKEMDRLRSLGDEFRSLGIDIRHVPVPEAKDGPEHEELRVFEPRDQVWSWDDNSRFV
ncbi:hypothetical protein FSARC_153 [Fusarium sarcochroum]|uniref:F-box domain-containing protein n=1 Tax=Fusarium sarcochroum TaxID=1208366 RepID=A0A8H4UCS7_9HYPO|nr:hypothetical protein FSARC_153 [Fusarium sarcochroum]